MRRFTNILESAVRISILLFCAIVFWLLLSSTAKGGIDSLLAPIDAKHLFKEHGKLLLDCKTYVKNLKPSYTRRARKVSIECIDLYDNSLTTYKSRSGKIKLEFKLNTRYLVYISKEGYETKMLAFSTKGANPVEKYEFDFDLQLEKINVASYDGYTPSIYIVFNRQHRLFLFKRFYNKSAINR